MTNAEIIKAREQYVVKGNEIIRQSRFSLSTQQQKVILYLISQIKPTDTEFQMYSIGIKDFCDICDIDSRSGQNYSDIKQAIESIAQKNVWVMIDDKTEAMLRWIEKAYINHQTGTIHIRLDNDLKPYLLQLKSHYTQYELFWTLRFKSKYSFRTYELIKSSHYNEARPYQITFQIDDLRQKLDTPPSYVYQAFKNRVLMPSIAEINKYSDKFIDFAELKGSRGKVNAIRLNIATKDYVERIKLYESWH